MADFQNAREMETDPDDSGDMTKTLQSLALQGSDHEAQKVDASAGADIVSFGSSQSSSVISTWREIVNRML